MNLLKKLALLTVLSLTTSLYAHDASSCAAGEIFIDSYKTCLGFEWLEGPYLNGRGERALSTLRLTFDTHRELDLTKAKVYPWMIMEGGHEHGARPVSIEIVDETEIIVRNILLMQMNGKWFIRLNLDAKDSDLPERDFEAQIPL